MSFFPGRLIFVLSLALAGCGVKEIGDAVGEGIGKGLACALSSGFNAFGSALEVEMDQSQYDQLTDFIRKNGIGDEAALYSKLDANSVAFLKKQITDAYAAVAATSSLRTAPVEFYINLYGFGLASAAQENLPLGKISFTMEVGTKQKDVTHYDSYRIRLKINNARSQEGKAYGRCK